jgi:hypothetical protein
MGEHLMAWKTIEPLIGRKTHPTNAPCAMTVVVASGKRPRLVLTFRSDLPWLTPEKRVFVQMGDGEHAGMIRVGPSTGSENYFILRNIPHRTPREGWCVLTIPDPDCIVRQKRRATAADVKFTEYDAVCRIPTSFRPDLPAPLLVKGGKLA